VEFPPVMGRSQRNYIGFEIDPNLVAICNQQLNEIKIQQESRLFC
jgi:hypothetical protein